MDDNKKTILWHSNAPWANTGYGNQTRVFGPRIQTNLDYNVVCSAFWGLQGATLKAYGMTVLPGYAEGYGNDVLRAHAQFTEADIALTLMDAWVLKPEITKQIPWAAWMPVDHDPIPPDVIHAIKEGEGVPIAMSKFGQDQLIDVGLDALYVPHAPDAGFFDTDDVDRDEVRKLRKWDDKFVIGMVAANKGWPSRKAFPEVFQAFKRFQDKHDDVHLHLHTKKDAPWGINLENMLEKMEIDLSKVTFVDQYQYVVGMGTNYMRDTYMSFDVLVNPAYGEGFGIPIIEAQAVGTPVIVNDWTAMPELVFSGTIVDGEVWYTAQNSWQKKPFIDDIYDAFEHHYANPATKMERAQLVKVVEGQYHPDIVTDTYWKPVLEECLVRLEGRKLLPEKSETEDGN